MKKLSIRTLLVLLFLSHFPMQFSLAAEEFNPNVQTEPNATTGEASSQPRDQGDCYIGYDCEGGTIGVFSDSGTCFDAGGESYDELDGTGCTNNF